MLSKIGNVVRTFGVGQRVRRNDEIESAVRETKESLNMWKRKGDTRLGRVQDSECKATMVVARVKAEAIEALTGNSIDISNCRYKRPIRQ